MEVRIPLEHELSELASIHLEAFDGFFLSELGPGFLKMYYRAICKNKRGILLGCYDENRLLGFCAATSISAGFNTSLLKENFLGFSFLGLRLLFSKPEAVIRLWKNFTKSDHSVMDDGRYAELLSIAVCPTAQGRGVGRRLLMSLEKHLKEKQIVNLSLTTDFFENEKTLNFYKGMDYEIMYEFIAYPKRTMYRLIKNIQI